jgi:hypothetical protein
VPIVNTGFFDAVMAPCAILAPVDDAVFTDAGAPGRDRLCLYVIFFRHMIIPRLYIIACPTIQRR